MRDRFTIDDVRRHNAKLAPPIAPAPSNAVAKESELHEDIKKECNKRLWFYSWSPMGAPSTQGVGVPDFIIGADGGRTFYIECKSKTGKLRPEQRETQAMLARNGHTMHVVRSLEEFLQIVTQLPPPT